MPMLKPTTARTTQRAPSSACRSIFLKTSCYVWMRELGGAAQAGALGWAKRLRLGPNVRLNQNAERKPPWASFPQRAVADNRPRYLPPASALPLLHLRRCSLARCCAVCPAWRTACRSQLMWTIALRTEFGLPAPPPGVCPTAPVIFARARVVGTWIGATAAGRIDAEPEDGTEEGRAGGCGASGGGAAGETPQEVFRRLAVGDTCPRRAREGHFMGSKGLAPKSSFDQPSFVGTRGRQRLGFDSDLEAGRDREEGARGVRVLARLRPSLANCLLTDRPPIGLVPQRSPLAAHLAAAHRLAAVAGGVRQWALRVRLLRAAQADAQQHAQRWQAVSTGAAAGTGSAHCTGAAAAGAAAVLGPAGGVAGAGTHAAAAPAAPAVVVRQEVVRCRGTAANPQSLWLRFGLPGWVRREAERRQLPAWCPGAAGAGARGAWTRALGRFHASSHGLEEGITCYNSAMNNTSVLAVHCILSG